MRVLISIFLALYVSLFLTALEKEESCPINNPQEMYEQLEKQFLIECEENNPWKYCPFYIQTKLCALGYNKECGKLRKAIKCLDLYPRRLWFGLNRPPRINFGNAKGLKEIPWEWIDAAREVLYKKNRINISKK